MLVATGDILGLSDKDMKEDECIEWYVASWLLA